MEIIFTPPIKRGITADKNRDIIWVNNRADLEKCMTQGFGESKLDYTQFRLKSHNGEDYALLKGEEIYPMAPGTVLSISKEKNEGLGVVIWHKEHNLKTIYWHNKRNVAKVGQKVTRDTVIAYGDSTGFSTGHHLHAGLKQTDDKGNTINKNNGWFGAIPFDHYFKIMVDEELLKLIYQGVFKRDPEEGAKGYLGKDIKTVLKLLLASKENEYYADLYNSAKVIENFGRKQG